MDSPTIVVSRTKEDLRKYNLFSAINLRPVRRTLQVAGPIIGLLQLLLFIFVVRNPLNLVIGSFLLLYPFLVRRSVIKASDASYETNNLSEYKVTITFNKEDFISETDVLCQRIDYSEIYKVFNRKEDLILYFDRFTGLYILKEYYDEQTMNNIIEILSTSIPEKF